jgi:hypothetical protein
MRRELARGCGRTLAGDFKRPFLVAVYAIRMANKHSWSEMWKRA